MHLRKMSDEEVRNLRPKSLTPKEINVKFALIVGYSPVNGYTLYYKSGGGDTAFKDEALKFNCETAAKYFASKTLGIKMVIIDKLYA